MDGELLQFLSPLGWEHINLTGDYVWRQSRRLEDRKFRPLRMHPIGGAGGTGMLWNTRQPPVVPGNGLCSVCRTSLRCR